MHSEELYRQMLLHSYSLLPCRNVRESKKPCLCV